MSYPFNQRLLPLAGAILALLLSGCEPVQDFFKTFPRGNGLPPQKTAPQGKAQSSSLAVMEASVRERINKIRQGQDLQPLKANERLAQVARHYSQQMASQNFFSHTSPDGSTLETRVGSAGIVYLIVGENLHTSTNAPQPVPLAVEGWMNSQGHRENILYPNFTETGVGIWRRGNSYYFTQLFMRPLLP